METFERPISRHKCLLYEGDPTELLSVVIPFLKAGLSQARRCLYLGDPQTLRIVANSLRAQGVDVDRETGRGALLLSSDRSGMDGDGFDPAAMVGKLRNLVQEASRDGFDGLYATGDMRWELGSDDNFDRLLEYEARLEDVFQELPLYGICQYHRGLVPARALRDALLTHSAVYLGESFDRDNLFYLPPELLIREPGRVVRDAQGEWMCRQLMRIIKAERERDEARAEARRLRGETET